MSDRVVQVETARKVGMKVGTFRFRPPFTALHQAVTVTTASIVTETKVVEL